VLAQWNYVFADANSFDYTGRPVEAAVGDTNGASISPLTRKKLMKQISIYFSSPQKTPYAYNITPREARAPADYLEYCTLVEIQNLDLTIFFDS